MVKKELFDYIIELQSLAQSGLYYGHDAYDKERYERIREISAELMALYLDQPVRHIQDAFCHEVGYQTPKLDTRAAIFNDEGKILLVQDSKGLWALPGGWVDIDTSIKENTEKEAKEESGLDVKATRIIAIEDRDKHNLPRYLYKIIKVFVLCEKIPGTFTKNLETVAADYFDLGHLPELSLDRNNFEQIQMCFEAYHNPLWQTYFD
ncbi:NUDIX hydrolase N-terminal domain-containing protein [Longibaculum muris]|uniref:NUDIX hydrolase N-terminal domain-containing protein n=1 Tax=Longibaculum muris TaxID=1796628 RepID=UPI003AB24763